MEEAEEVRVELANSSQYWDSDEVQVEELGEEV